MEEYLTKQRTRPATRASMRPVLIAVAAAFALGASLAGYGVYRLVGESHGSSAGTAARVAALPSATASSPAEAPSPAPSASEAARQAVERVQEQQGGLDQRIAAAEQRIARLDLQAQAAAGNTARAEGLLIAFSARRALDRGQDLGFLADQLRLRFGDAMPNAVQTIIAFGRAPVTLDQLIARLDGLGPELAQSPRAFSWSRLRQELSQLFVVRRESTPSPEPRRRLERARLFLQSGRVEAAVAEVRNLPGATRAAAWTRDAHRYAAAHNALDLIETAAVLEPRKLRDGAGNRVEQASPADAVPIPASGRSGAQ